MLNLAKNKNHKPKEIDTREITSIINQVLSMKSENNLDDSRLKLLRTRLDTIIESFNTTYKEILRHEIRILNLKIAAEAIEERNDFINQIYEVAIKELTITPASK